MTDTTMSGDNGHFTITDEMVGRAEAHLREWYERDGNLRWIVPTGVLRTALEDALRGGAK